MPPDIEVDLTVEHIPRQQLKVGKSFDIDFKLVVQTPPENGRTEPRQLKLVVQHVQVQAVDSPDTPKVEPQAAADPMSALSAVSTPSPTGTPLRGGPNWPITSEPSRSGQGSDQTSEHGLIETLPPPTHIPTDEQDKPPSSDALFVGSSSVLLPEITMLARQTSSQRQTVRFPLTFVPTKSGVISIGGLRLFLVHDSGISSDSDRPSAIHDQRKPRLLSQWTTITEVYVDS